MTIETQTSVQPCHQDVIRERIRKLEEWLTQIGSNCDEEQAHLEPGSPARIYWHFGYLCALRDVLKLLGAPVPGH